MCLRGTEAIRKGWLYYQLVEPSLADGVGTLPASLVHFYASGDRHPVFLLFHHFRLCTMPNLARSIE